MILRGAQNALQTSSSGPTLPIYPTREAEAHHEHVVQREPSLGAKVLRSVHGPEANSHHPDARVVNFREVVAKLLGVLPGNAAVEINQIETGLGFAPELWNRE